MYQTKDKLFLENIFFTIANQHTHARNRTIYNFTQNLIFHNIICCFSETYKVEKTKKLFLVISFRDITTQTTTNTPTVQ